MTTDEQSLPPLPPHVEQWLRDAREVLAVTCAGGAQPVRLVLRWRLDGGEWGDMTKTFAAPKSKRKAVAR